MTGLLVGIFVGVVELTTHVLPFASPVGVADSTPRLPPIVIWTNGWDGPIRKYGVWA